MALKTAEHKKHILLIVALVSTMILFSALAAKYSNGELAKGLTSRIIYVQPGSNGLAHVSSQNPEQNLSNSIDQVGGSVGNSIILQSVATEY